MQTLGARGLPRVMHRTTQLEWHDYCVHFGRPGSVHERLTNHGATAPFLGPILEVTKQPANVVLIPPIEDSNLIPF